jgi:hypothetical protein
VYTQRTSVLPRWTILVRLCISCKSRNMLMTTQRLRIHFFPKCETKLRTFCHVTIDSQSVTIDIGYLLTVTYFQHCESIEITLDYETESSVRLNGFVIAGVQNYVQLCTLCVLHIQANLFEPM